MTYETKLDKYRRGLYRMRVADVCHGHWSESDWVRYIDAHGLWL
jgi:hypothetical protein